MLCVNNSIDKEKYFSVKNYIGNAVYWLALAVFLSETSYSGTTNIVLVAMGWCLFSAAIVVCNRTAVEGRGQKTARVAHTMMTEINSVATVSQLTIRHYFSPIYYRPRNFREGGLPIIAMNGYMGTASNLDYQMQILHANGCGPIYPLNMKSFVSIQDNVKQLSNFVKEHKLEKMAFLAHSKGGLVATAYAMDGNESKVAFIASLGTPFKGTSLAKRAIGPDAGQMWPGSIFLEKLHADIKKAQTTQFLFISSSLDGFVSKESAVPFEGGLCQSFILPDVGHLGYVCSSAVGKKVSEKILEIEKEL